MPLRIGKGYTRQGVEQLQACIRPTVMLWALAPGVPQRLKRRRNIAFNTALKRCSAQPPDRAAPSNLQIRITSRSSDTPSLLTYPRLARYHSSSLLFGADLGFHAEWLRDEPYEATTTGSELIFWSPGVNSRPAKGEHEIRGAEFPASRSSFLSSRERGFRVSGHLLNGSSRQATPKRVAQ
jgi:hypothetical protein